MWVDTCGTSSLQSLKESKYLINLFCRSVLGHWRSHINGPTWSMLIAMLINQYILLYLPNIWLLPHPYDNVFDLPLPLSVYYRIMADFFGARKRYSVGRHWHRRPWYYIAWKGRLAFSGPGASKMMSREGSEWSKDYYMCHFLEELHVTPSLEHPMCWTPENAASLSASFTSMFFNIFMLAVVFSIGPFSDHKRYRTPTFVWHQLMIQTTQWQHVAGQHWLGVDKVKSEQTFSSH